MNILLWSPGVYINVVQLYVLLLEPENVEICEIVDGNKRCRSLSKGRKGLLSHTFTDYLMYCT